jgi:hypothetical protein
MADTYWTPLIEWMIQQNAFEFTPDITNPSVINVCTLEDPNTGLELDMTEMLPEFPGDFQTPLMKYRIVPGTN